LQTNELLIADFGHLYNAPRSKEEATLKRVSNFITNNGIRVEAHTALTPMRGRLYQNHRPEFVLRDDLENAITAESPAITEKIVKLLDEAKGGMASHGASLNLGNYIIENGVMGYIRKATEGAGGRVRFVPVVDKAGNVSWPDKYVKTDLEAVEANKDIPDPSRRKISLESKKRELNAGGRRVYELKRQADLFGTCLIGPEKNSESGGSCLTTLKMIYPVDMIYRQIPPDRLKDVAMSQNAELGFETNTATKYTILNALKTAVEDG